MPGSAALGMNSRQRNRSESGITSLFGRMLRNGHDTADPNTLRRHIPTLSSPNVNSSNDSATIPSSSRPDDRTNNDTLANSQLEEGTTLPIGSTNPSSNSASTSNPLNPASGASPNTDATTVDADASSQLPSKPLSGRKAQMEPDMDNFTRLQVAVLVRMPTPPHPVSTSFPSGLLDAKLKVKAESGYEPKDLVEKPISASSCGSTLEDDSVDQVPVLEIGLVDVNVYPGLGSDEGGEGES